jgi:hypothetical protein
MWLDTVSSSAMHVTMMALAVADAVSLGGSTAACKLHSVRQGNSTTYLTEAPTPLLLHEAHFARLSVSHVGCAFHFFF